MASCEQAIKDSLMVVGSSMDSTGWALRHLQAWSDPKGFERPVVAMYQALAQYADSHAARYGSPIGEDYVIGKDGWLPMLQALRVLLNGETGRLDCGTLDRLAFDLAKAAGYEEAEVAS